MTSLAPRFAPLALGALWAVATAQRWAGLARNSALGDALGPFWSAARAEAFPPPHAPIYGGALAAPYRLILWGAGSLWEAFAALHALHALAAPLAAALVWRLGGGAWAACAAGLLVALDPGLLDTTWSGAEGYLGAVWVGGLAWLVHQPGRAGQLAPLLLAGAFANHPLALCAAPLLVLAPRGRLLWASVAFAGAWMLPQVLRLWAAEAGGGAPGLGVAGVAVEAWLRQGRGVAVALLAATALGLARRRTRPLALATLVALALLLLAGGALGYLRDHHLRLLTVPLVGGLAAAGWPAAVLAGAAVAWTLATTPPEPGGRGQERRPGTLGLETLLVTQIAGEVPPPLIVEGVWVDGSPAAEAGGVMLDLHLRGWPRADFGPGGAVVLLVSAERGSLQGLPADGGLRRLRDLDRGRVLLGTAAAARDWTGALCASEIGASARVGGAWDGLAALRPSLGAGVTEAWSGCPDARSPR